MGRKLYLMDLTSSFTTLVLGDTEEMTRTNTRAWKHLKAHIFIQHPPPPPHNTSTWRSCLCSKFNYPLIDTSRGYLRCRHELWFPRGATGSSLCPNREGPPLHLPPPLLRCVFAWLTRSHTHPHTKTNTSAPPNPCPRRCLFKRCPY